MRYLPKLIAAASTALLALAGCSTPKHTDLLVFGTNTSLGVSIKGDATSTAGVDIGYRRQEVVLMPLYVNGAQSKTPPPAAAPLGDTKYQGIDTEARKDTYSVLASFGAKASGSGSGGAGVSIAQYFATGIAARTLALAGGALVTTSDVGAKQSITPAAVSAEKAADIRKWISEHDAKVVLIADKVSDASTGKTDAAKVTAAFKDIPGAPDADGLAAINTRDDVIKELNLPQYDSQLDQILKNVSP
jgi:hypothetical protein